VHLSMYGLFGALLLFGPKEDLLLPGYLIVLAFLWVAWQYPLVLLLVPLMYFPQYSLTISAHHAVCLAWLFLHHNLPFFSPWPCQWPPFTFFEELLAITMYTWEKPLAPQLYSEVNNALRGFGVFIPAWVNDYVAVLDRAVEKLPTYCGTLYRGQTLAVGPEFTWHSFSSCTYSHTIAFQFAVPLTNGWFRYMPSFLHIPILFALPALYCISKARGKDIQFWAQSPEKEYLLCRKSRLIVDDTAVHNFISYVDCHQQLSCRMAFMYAVTLCHGYVPWLFFVNRLPPLLLFAIFVGRFMLSRF